MLEMNSTPVLRRVKDGYTTGARSLASRSVTRLARTGVTPNVLTTTGVSLCLAAAVLVPFEDRADKVLVYWLAAAIFVLGSLLDILDGALARVGGKATPFGAFIDSTTDRVGEGAMLAAIALVFSRHGEDWAVAVAVAAVVGSFLVSYTRARAEALGLKGDVGLGSRAERVVLITAGLVFAPWGGLPWAIVVLAATAWLGRWRGTVRLDMPKRRAWAVLAAAGIALAAIGAVSAHDDARLKAGLDRAIAARDRGDLATAIRVLEDLDDTGSHVPHAMLGEIHYRTGALGDARRELERAVAIQPSFVRGHRFLAVIALRQGDLAGAAACAKRGLAVRPDDLELAYLAGTDVLERTLEAGPKAASTIVSLAYEVADVRTARLIADQALARWPDDARLAGQRRRLDR
jgi:CDP-diacylglycerol--glycerol-3-phosphate 3-phosphatidyltransferase